MRNQLVLTGASAAHRPRGMLIVLLCLALSLPAALAGKPPNPGKERLVLMPLRVPEEDNGLLGAMETALVQGLQQRYEVVSGEPVAAKAREIFNRETRASGGKVCDEGRCMQGIASAFQADFIATANVTKRTDGYFLALSIQNVFDTLVVLSSSTPCQNCNAYQVVDELKELSSVSFIAPPAILSAELAGPVIIRRPADPDTVQWEVAQKGDSAEDYQVYLDSFPRGKYRHYAQTRISKIGQAAQSGAALQQQHDWYIAQQENSTASYEHYLNLYPDGHFAGFARVRLGKLGHDLAAREEAELWQAAESSNGRVAILGYLARYPAGRYAGTARIKLGLIREQEGGGPLMVRIPGKNYEIGKYEVTQAEWRAVMGNNPSEFRTCGDRCPVEKVSWNDAQQFIRKLNERTGRQYRLPTEAEWVYACEGGNKTEYCGGNDINVLAWTAENSLQQTIAVGHKQANGYGLYDMSGNVWEWVGDCWQGNCRQRGLRGGSWSDVPQFARAAFRYWSDIVYLNDDVGFRLARTLP